MKDQKIQALYTASNQEHFIQTIRKKGFISIDDDITFPRIVDVLNDLFDKGFGGFQRAVCHINHEINVWFPKLDYFNKKGEQKPATKYWHNYFYKNKKDTLVEYPTPKCDLEIIKKWPHDLPLKKWRPYTFAMHEGSYKFIGIFERHKIAKAGELGITLDIKPNQLVAIYKRLETKAGLPKWKGN